MTRPQPDSSTPRPPLRVASDPDRFARSAHVAPDAAPAEVVEGEVLDAETPELRPEGSILEAELVGLPDAIGPDGELRPADAGELAFEVRQGPRGEELIPVGGGHALLVRDALSRYLADVSRYERLTPEEEHALAVRVRRDGDREALARLVTGNLRLVVAVALSFRRAFANVLDLIQEGNLGLLEAVDRFDPHHGTRLSTYATFWIRSRIVKYLLDNWRLVRVGTTNARRKLIYGLRQEKERMAREGVQPTPKLLASRMGVTEEDVVAVDMAMGARDSSLDAPVGEDGDATRGDLLPGTSPSPETLVADQELRDKFAQALAAFGRDLAPRERALLHERLLADEPATLQALADRDGVTREAVRQSEARLVSRLRTFLKERFPDVAEIRFQAD